MLDQGNTHKANNKFIIFTNLKFLRHSISEAEPALYYIGLRTQETRDTE